MNSTLVVGGGTAMMLAYQLPVRTTEVVAYPARGRLDDVAPQLRAVAKELGLAPDWVNPHFETFAHVLPADYDEYPNALVGRADHGRISLELAAGGGELGLSLMSTGRSPSLRRSTGRG